MTFFGLDEGLLNTCLQEFGSKFVFVTSDNTYYTESLVNFGEL